MFFNRRKRYNGDVSALLPAFGIDIKEVGTMKVLRILDVAYADSYSIYEATLTVAYAFIYELNETDSDRAYKIAEERLKPIQADWINKDIVRKEITDLFLNKWEELSHKPK